MKNRSPFTMTPRPIYDPLLTSIPKPQPKMSTLPEDGMNQPETERGDLATHMMRLRGTLDQLDANLQNLEGKLVPVLRNMEPYPATPLDCCHETPAGQELHSILTKVQSLVDSVHNLTARVSV